MAQLPDQLRKPIQELKVQAFSKTKKYEFFLARLQENLRRSCRMKMIQPLPTLRSDVKVRIHPRFTMPIFPMLRPQMIKWAKQTIQTRTLVFFFRTREPKMRDFLRPFRSQEHLTLLRE